MPQSSERSAQQILALLTGAPIGGGSQALEVTLEQIRDAIANGGFGGSDPLVLANWMSVGADPAASGLIRVPFGADAMASRNVDGDGDFRLIRSILSGMDYPDRDAIRIGDAGIEEIQFEVGADGPRMALSDAEHELWFFNTGVTFARGLFSDPIQTLKDSGYIDHSSEHVLFQAAVATALAPYHGVGFIDFQTTLWDGLESQNQVSRIYADNWNEADGNAPYMYFQFEGGPQIAMDGQRRIWPDNDSAGSLGKEGGRWAALWLDLPTSAAGLATGQVWRDAAADNVLKMVA